MGRLIKHNTQSKCRRSLNLFGLDITQAAMSPLTSGHSTATNSTTGPPPPHLPGEDNHNTAVNIVFGLAMLFLSAVMIWQNTRVLKAWLRASSRGSEMYELAAHVPEQHTESFDLLSPFSFESAARSEPQDHSSSAILSARIDSSTSSVRGNRSTFWVC